jgi:hypothetical protein
MEPLLETEKGDSRNVITPISDPQQLRLQIATDIESVDRPWGGEIIENWLFAPGHCFDKTCRHIRMDRSAQFYVDCNSEAAILKPVNPNNLSQRRGITAIIGCVPQNHANAHPHIVVLYPGREI